MKTYLKIFFLLAIFSFLDAEPFWEKTGFPSQLTCNYISVSPNGQIFVNTCSNNGIFISKDDCQTWQKLNLDSSITVNSFYYKDSIAFICSNKGLFRSTNFGLDWSLFAFENKNIYSVIQNKQKDILVSYYEENATYPACVRISTNNGYSWKKTSNGDFATYIEIYLHELINDEILFLSNRSINWHEWISIESSSDLGNNIQNKSTWSTKSFFSDYSACFNGNVLLHRYTDNFLFFWNNDRHQLDSLLLDTYISSKGINSSVFSKEGDIFISSKSGQDGVFQSKDFAKSWTELYDGLDHNTVYCLAIDSTGILYAGTDSGIYRSRTTILSIKEAERNNLDLFVYPNPASDFIEINLSNQILKGVVEVIRIYDVLGIEQPTSPQPLSMLGEGAVRIDLSSLSPGVYFVRIGDVVRKFVKL